MPELSKLLEHKRAWDALDPATKAAQEAEAWASMKTTFARMDAYIEEALEGVPQDERWRFEQVPIHELRRQKVLYLAARKPHLDAALRVQAQQRPRERRERRTARAVGSRGDPSEPDPDLAHRHDREVIAAVWRYQRAKAGKGYKFKIPPGVVG